ncbi:MAG: hypothetical protein KDD64_02220 [Bdellovibrionales bacterium]|nr:hypothetical protein [Bdellovibrionales bacterium]
MVFKRIGISFAFLSLLVLGQATCFGDVRFSVEVLDEGRSLSAASNGPFVDTVQNECQEDDEPEDLEPFQDTILKLLFTNSEYVPFVVRRHRIRVSDGGDGRPFRTTRRQAFIGGTLQIPPSEDLEERYIFLMEMRDRKKYFDGSSTELPEDLGFQTVKVSVIGRFLDGSKRRHRVTAKLTVSFQDFDRCP